MKAKWILILIVLAFCLSGCEEAMFQGVAIGVGASEATTSAMDLAKETKMQLVAEILRLRQELSEAATPEEKADLEARLDVLIKRQETAAITEAVLTTVKEGIGKDWASDDPETQSQNWAWIAGLVASILYGGNETRKRVAADKAIERVKIANKPPEEKAIYEALSDV